MLLQEKMGKQKFSPSEQIVVNFILKQQELIKNYSTTMIAADTYTSPSILIRISKKLGFSGYNEFKKVFLDEIAYLKANFQGIDANRPFNSTDSIMNIANKITKIKIESLKDTLFLIEHDSLQEAIGIMRRSQTIKVFAISNLSFQAEEFVFKIRHIGKKAETYSISNTMYQEATMTSSNDCAICISYSGESGELLSVTKYLLTNHVPVIAITSIGENSLAKLADVSLRTTTREKSYSKIAAFTSLESVALILDILYSCYFKIEYQKHYQYKVNLAQSTESRQIDNQIIQEE